jgi:hypothetical protein
MEKYDFIKLMLRNRSLSINDKKRLVLLATNEIEQNGMPLSGTTPPTEEKEDIHAPKETASFLSLFSDPNGFKFLTHDFDPDSDWDYDKLIAVVTQAFRKSCRQYNIPKRLYVTMLAMISGGETPKHEPRTWIDWEGKPHSENYASSDWVEWAKDNPGLHLLSNDKFADSILKFRSSIRLVHPMLLDIIKRQASKHSNLNIQTENLDRADFYTYVWALENGIKRILDDMARYSAQTPNVKIVFERQFSDAYSLRIIKITQLGSVATSLDDVIKKFKSGGGAFNEIKKMFVGYCNWSVEALWDGQPKRWNILNDDNVDEVENIHNTEIHGFTHILTYFSK